MDTLPQFEVENVAFGTGGLTRHGAVRVTARVDWTDPPTTKLTCPLVPVPQVTVTL
jgi:hypothetical protein